jgi:hypothetical protein
MLCSIKAHFADPAPLFRCAGVPPATLAFFQSPVVKELSPFGRGKDPALYVHPKDPDKYTRRP